MEKPEDKDKKMIRVWTPYRQWFRVKNPKKIRFWKKMAEGLNSIIIKELK